MSAQREDGWLEVVEQFRRCRANGWAVALTKRQVEVALGMLETALLQRTADSRPSPALEPSPFDPDFMARNSAYVAAMPDWKKGSPANERTPEQPKPSPVSANELRDKARLVGVVARWPALSTTSRESLAEVVSALLKTADWMEGKDGH